MTVDQCDELAKALREDAAQLPRGSDKENLLQLAENYRVLADMKRMVFGKLIDRVGGLLWPVLNYVDYRADEN